ncbi:MAG: HEAT repeat domain-containing protein, partial [Planctomycetota bacterium]
HRVPPLFLGPPESAGRPGGTERAGLRPTVDQMRGDVVPAIDRLLDPDTDEALLAAALIARAKVERTVPSHDRAPLRARVSSFLRCDPTRADAPRVAEAAALALGLLGDAEATNTLLGLALDDEEGRAHVGGPVPSRLRAFAAYALGLLGERTLDVDVRDAVRRGLLEVLERAPSTELDVRVGAVRALAVVPFPRTEPAARSRTAGVTRLDPATVVARLWRFVDEDGSVPADRGSALLRAQIPIAASRIVMRGGPSTNAAERCRAWLVRESVVLARATGGAEEVRWSALIALGVLCGDSADPIAREASAALFERACSPDDEQARCFASMALARAAARAGSAPEPLRLREEVERFLLGAVTSEPLEVGAWSALGLGVLGRARLDAGGRVSNRTRRVLRSAFQERRSPAFRGAYALALGLVEDRGASGLLLDALRRIGRGQDALRGDICLALGLMRADDAADTLVELVGSSRYRVPLMRHAALGLALVGDPRAAGVLEARLTDAVGLASLTAIAAGIGGLSESTSVNRLLPRLRAEPANNRTGAVRPFVCAAIGIACDCGDVPWRAVYAAGWNHRASGTALVDLERATGLLDVL